MAVQKKQFKGEAYIGLPYDTIIEVVATKGDQVIKKQISYGEALSMKKAKGWIYSNYQKGFCSMQDTKKEQ